MTEPLKTLVACPICDGQYAHYRAAVGINPIACCRCGRFKSDGTWLNPANRQARVKLSGYVREQNAAGVTPLITMEIARRAMERALPRYMERARRALGVIARKAPSLDHFRNDILSDPELQGVSYSSDNDEAYTLIRLLDAEGLVEIFADLKQFRLTPKGLLVAEEMSQMSRSAQVFVAMHFHQSMDEAWSRGFYEGIKGAGYEPLRIDEKDHVNGITDEIMVEIRRSKFIVADYTGEVKGVYFEAGFALGLGLPVIPTCRADAIDKLHFDIRHINTLQWSTPDELATDLSRRIRAVIGPGPGTVEGG